MNVKYTTTCAEIVRQLLAKYRLKHRDPRLFNISLEVATRGTGQFTLLSSHLLIPTSRSTYTYKLCTSWYIPYDPTTGLPSSLCTVPYDWPSSLCALCDKFLMADFRAYLAA